MLSQSSLVLTPFLLFSENINFFLSFLFNNFHKNAEGAK